MKITQAIIILSAVVLAAGCANEEHRVQYDPYDESISPYTHNGTARYQNNNNISLGGSYSTPGGTITGGSVSESDDTIVTNVRESLERDPEIAPIVPNLQITANNGTVLLNGPVQSEEQKRQIGSLIGNVGGVMSVNNQLQVPSNAEQNQNRTGEGESAGTANQGSETGGAMGQSSGQNEQNSSPPSGAGEGGTLNPTSTSDNSPSQIYQNSSNSMSDGALNPTSASSNSPSHIYQEPGMQNTSSNALNPTSRTNGESQIYEQNNQGQNNQQQNMNNNQNP